MPRTAQTTALILSVTPYRDNDMMVRVFTAEGGSFSAIAYRSRASRSRFPSGLDAITLVDAAFSATTPARITLTSATVKELFWNAKTDFSRTCAASLVCELLMKTHAHGAETARLFVHALVLLGQLDREGDRAVSPEAAALAAGVVVARDLAFLPGKVQCGRCSQMNEGGWLLQVDTGELTCTQHGRASGAVRLSTAEASLLDRVLCEGDKFPESGPDPAACKALLDRLQPFLERLVDGPLRSLGALLSSAP